MTAIQPSELTLFKQDVYAGNYNQAQLDNFIKQGSVAGVNARATMRADICKDYLSSKGLTITATSIKMPSSTKPDDTPVLDGEQLAPDVSDIGVARKFLQVMESANRRGIEFTLSLNDVRKLIKKKKCYYTDLPFDHTDKEKSLTFDRRDSSMGYTKENVVACHYGINQVKNLLLEHNVSIFKDNVPLLLKFAKRCEV